MPTFGYAPKGKTPVLKVQTVKLHINMISAISNRGKVHFMFSQESINSEKLIDFMERLMATPHKARLTALHAICLHLFRHISQKAS